MGGGVSQCLVIGGGLTMSSNWGVTMSSNCGVTMSSNWGVTILEIGGSQCLVIVEGV